VLKHDPREGFQSEGMKQTMATNHCRYEVTVRYGATTSHHVGEHTITTDYTN
jgi:hypothetical protein